MGALNTSTVLLWFCLGKTRQCHWSGRYSITKSLIFQACQRRYVILYVKCLCKCEFIHNFKSVFWCFKLMVHMFYLLRHPCFNLPVLIIFFSSAKNYVQLFEKTYTWKDFFPSKHYKLSFLKTYKNHIPILFE